MWHKCGINAPEKQEIMPLQVSKSEFETILVVMARFPDGAPIRVLMEQAELSSYKRRTLQRRLDHLLADGRLVSRGGGRGFHYALAAAPPVSSHAGITPPPWGFPSRVREDEPAPPFPVATERWAIGFPPARGNSVPP